MLTKSKSSTAERAGKIIKRDEMQCAAGDLSIVSRRLSKFQRSFRNSSTLMPVCLMMAASVPGFKSLL